MRILGFLLQKEFIQICRDRTNLFLIVLILVLQLIVLPRSASMDVREIRMSVVDHDKSSASGDLLRKMMSTGLFRITQYTDDVQQALESVACNEADCLLQFPAGFEKQLMCGEAGRMMLDLDAVNGVRAGISYSYAMQVIQLYADEWRNAWGVQPGFPEVTEADLRARQEQAGRRTSAVDVPMPDHRASGQVGQVELMPDYRYNPDMKSQYFRIPAIIAMLISLIGGILSAMNIVTEKENGTIEQMNVSPVRKSLFILAKLIPFWVIGLVILTISLVLVSWMYGVVPVGSYWDIYVFSFLFLVAFAGFGMLLSTYCTTQQQAMLLCFFFLMIVCLLCGMWTLVRSMPAWARWIAAVNPLRYYVEAMRLFFAVGSRLQDIWGHVCMMFVFILVFNGWAIWNYRKQ